MTTPPVAAPAQRDVLVLRNLLAGPNLDALDWRTWVQPGRTDSATYPLYTTDDDREASAFLVRYGPGAHGDLHEHLGYELMFVLAGELVNDNGDRYTVGDLVIEEPGSVHQVSSVTGFTVLAVREAPTVPR